MEPKDPPAPPSEVPPVEIPTPSADGIGAAMRAVDGSPPDDPPPAPQEARPIVDRPIVRAQSWWPRFAPATRSAIVFPERRSSATWT